MRIRSLTLGALAALAAVALVGCSSATGSTSSGDGADEAWPAAGTDIEWIVPSAAGAGNDILARIVAPVMQESLDANIQVVNLEGGSQVVGLSKLATSAPDGTTFGYTNIPSILGRYLDPSKNATFDRESFLPVGSFATNSVVIGVAANSPYETIDDLFDAVKDDPGTITAGTDSRAGDDHVNLRILENELDLGFNIVHYNSGADKVAAVMSGEVNFALGGVSSFYGPYKSGDIRLLAIVEDEQSELMPDVPTLSGEGYEVAPMNSRFTLSVPAETPENIRSSLEAALKVAAEDPAVIEKLTNAATVASWMPGAEVAKLWEEREATISPIIDELLQVSP